MDTKAFNEKNFDKSRAVCEGIEREDGDGRVVLTDRERQILDMWPRFEDTGEPVWLGDSFADNKGESREIEGITLFSHGIDLYDDEGFHKPLDYGERLTRARADSWERLEMDAELNDETGIVGGNLDIVRRAKALAGVE